VIRDDAIAFVLRPDIEGGYVDDADDPGGETNYGISKKAHPGEDIKNLTPQRAAEIYRTEYWNPVARRVVDMAPRLAFVLFDSSVNQGKGAAAKMLQGVLHAAQDGIIGPRTLDALQDTLDAHDEAWVIEQFMVARAVRYTQTSNWSKFGKGWMVRCMKAMSAVLSYGEAPAKPVASSTILPELLDQIMDLIKVARSEVG
jgi:lysozyme family protein